MPPADPAQLGHCQSLLLVRDDVEDKRVHGEDPGVPLTRVGVTAADDDQVKGRGIREQVAWLVGRVEEGKGAVGSDRGEGADVRVADLDDEWGAVGVEEDGDFQWVGGGHGAGANGAHVE